MLYIYFCGLCMGAADLVPGISGGTIAFIMGFYYSLLESLKTVNGHSCHLLLQGKIGPFFQAVAWRFLLPLGLGITTSFVLLSGAIHFILSHDVYRIYLYAAFTGLVLASTLFCVRLVEKWTLTSIALLITGFFIAFFFTGSKVESHTMYQAVGFIDPWLIVSGVLAISAMLLPGVSGSYLLTLLGVYPAAIAALAGFISALKNGSFDSNALVILGNILVGILAGLFSFARVVSWLLKDYPNLTLSFLTGLMTGGVRCVWVFTPDLGGEMTYHSLLFCAGGFLLVLALERVAQQRQVASPDR